MLISLDFLLNIALVLLVGFVGISFADRYKLPHALPLLLGGLFLSLIKLNGEPLITLPHQIILGFILIATCIISFDASSRAKIPFISPSTKEIVKLTLLNTGLCIIFLAPAIQWLFFRSSENKIIPWFGAIIVAIMMAETSLDTVSSTFRKIKNRALNLLEDESTLNTPLFLTLVFLIILMMDTFGTGFTLNSHTLIAYGTSIILSVASAFIIGIIFFRFMRGSYSEKYSPFALFTGIIVTYVIASMVGGSGILAVILVGLFYGKIYVKEKMLLEEFSTTFSSLIEMVAYILLGFFFTHNIGLEFVLFSLLVYAALLLLRYIAIQISLSSAYSFEEKLFFTVNSPKGISVAIIALFLIVGTSIPGTNIITNLSILLIIFSQIAHTIIMWNKKDLT